MIRLITFANLACLAMFVSTGCKTVTRVEQKPAIASAIPVEMTARQPMPSATQTTLLYARQLEEQGKASEAASIYEQLLVEQADNSVALHRLAVIHSQLGEFEKAEQYFQEVISLDPHNAEVLCDFGFNCFLQNKLIDAEKSYLSALNKGSDIKRLHNNLAVLYARTDRADHALEQFRAAGCDPATARQNLFAAKHDPSRQSRSIRPPVDAQPATNSIQQQPKRSTNAPIIMNFSSAPSRHLDNPMTAMGPTQSDGFDAGRLPEIAQVAFWEPVAEVAPASIAQQAKPSDVTSSRRTYAK